MPQEGDEGRVYNPTSGYSEPAPGSSPAQDAELAGEPSAPIEQAPQHQPAPGSDRFNEVYRNWRDEERRRGELEARLAQYESLEATMAQGEQPAPEATPQPQGQEYADGWQEMKGMMVEAAREAVAPIHEEMASFKRAQAATTVLDGFKQRHPEYNAQRDDTDIRAYLNRRVPLEEAWKLVQYDRGVAGQPAPVPSAPAPIGDVPSAPGASTPATNLEALVEEFHKTPENAIEKRRWLASQISDHGYGSAEAEAALGL